MQDRIINNWRPEVGSLIRRLIKAGFKVTRCDNGETFIKCDDSTPIRKMVDNLTACDEGSLYIEKDGHRSCLFLVLGNSPGELVCDYTLPKDPATESLLDKTTQEHYDAWEGRKQPKTTFAKAYGLPANEGPVA